jgi:nicotinamidase-related amidase
MKIVVVVDMQNDFIDGVLGTPEAQAIVPVMVDRLRELDDGNTLLFFTKDTHFANYLETQEGKNLPVAHCIEGTPGWSINKQISSYTDYGSNFLTYSTRDIRKSRVLKHTFGSTELADIIRELVYEKHKHPDIEIDEVILMGVCTDICVISNAMLLKAYCPELLITVDASCCAGVTPETHAAALTTMKSCQINVIND